MGRETTVGLCQHPTKDFTCAKACQINRGYGANCPRRFQHCSENFGCGGARAQWVGKHRCFRPLEPNFRGVLLPAWGVIYREQHSHRCPVWSSEHRTRSHVAKARWRLRIAADSWPCYLVWRAFPMAFVKPHRPRIWMPESGPWPRAATGWERKYRSTSGSNVADRPIFAVRQAEMIAVKPTLEVEFTGWDKTRITC
jgi:hypothetical protein